MKRITFLIVVVSFATCCLNSGVISAQGFPSTDHGSFVGQPILIPEAPASALSSRAATGAQMYGSTGVQGFNGPSQAQVFPSSVATQGFAATGAQSFAPQSFAPQQTQSFAQPYNEVPPAQGYEPVYQDGGFIVEDSQFVAEQSGFGDEQVDYDLEGPVFNRSGRRRARRRANNFISSTASVSGLLLGRNIGDNRDFSTNANGDILSSDNAEAGVLGGIDASYSRRNVNGLGLEARYFGVFSGDQSIQIGDNAISLLTGLTQIGTSVSAGGPGFSFLAGPSANSFFTAADTHVLTRQTDLDNVEFNILASTRPRFRAASTELLVGFRYFEFGETLLYEAVDIPQGDPMFASPSSIGYFSTVENQLLGAQIGIRSDYQLRKRIALHVGLKGGVFNNRVNTRQRVDYRLRDGSIINPLISEGELAGQRFDVGAEENVKALLGEVDLALSFRISRRSRIRVGYRGLAVSDIAFASDQIQDDFTDATGFESPDTDGDLVLQGGYVGLEFAY